MRAGGLTAASPMRRGPARHASPAALRCRRKFLRYFPGGSGDETYVDWERGYKWRAHEQWNAVLDGRAFRDLLRSRRFQEIAAHAVRIESRTNLLFSCSNSPPSCAATCATCARAT